MAHDFAKTHKTASARRTKQQTSAPAWLLLLAGTLAGAFVMLLVYLAGIAPAARAPAPAVSAAKPAAANPEIPAPKRTSPVFEFYSRLPENKRAITDTTAMQRAQRLQQAQQMAAAPLPPATPVATDPATPPPTSAPPETTPAEQSAQTALKENAAIEPKTTAPTAASATTVAVAAAPPVKTQPTAKPRVLPPRPVPAVKVATASVALKSPSTTPSNHARYMLQAGTFRNKADADRQRAKALMLGMKASARPMVNAQGETLLKVWIGPFASASAMENARTLLTGNHIQTAPAP